MQRAATGSSGIYVLSFHPGRRVRVLRGHYRRVWRQGLRVGLGVSGRGVNCRCIIKEGRITRWWLWWGHLVALRHNTKALCPVIFRRRRHLEQSVSGGLVLRLGLFHGSVVSGNLPTFLRVGLVCAGDAVLGLPVSGKAIGVSEGFPAHFTAEELLVPAFVNGLVVRRQVEMMAERLPAYSAGVKAGRWLRVLFRWGLRLRIAVLRLDILRVGVIG